MLEPVRDSFRTGNAIAWTRVHDVPDFVYFDHSIHLKKGIGCVTCHGRVDQMPLMWQEKSLQMEWCLECHRAPERFCAAALTGVYHGLGAAVLQLALGPTTGPGVPDSAPNLVLGVPPMMPSPPPAIDLIALRQRLTTAHGPAFWRSLEELAHSEARPALLAREFPPRRWP